MKPLLAWSLSQGANALNIVAGIIVAHVASPQDFGRFATLSASIAIMTAVLNPMINEIAQRIAPHRGIALSSLTLRSLYATLACCLIAVSACSSIVTSSFDALIIFLLIPFLLVGHSWATGILYGMHRMVAFGAIACLAGIARVFTLSVLLYLGATFEGITISYLASFLLALASSYYLLRETLHTGSSATWHTNWPLLCGFFLLALPFSIDQTIVQACFPDISADYAALMTYARSVMLLASPALTIVYSASLQPTDEHQRTSPQRRLPPLVITSLLAGLLAFGLWYIHPWLFPLLLGSQYMHTTPHLAVALLGITLFVVSYFLIQRMLVSCGWWLCAALSIPPLMQSALLLMQFTPSVSTLASISVATFALQGLIALVATYLSCGERTSQ